MQNTNHIETKTNTAPRQWLVAYVQSCLEKKDCATACRYGHRVLPARPERDSSVERPPQTGRPSCDSHDDIRACHSAGTAASPEPAGGQPLYGTARRKHPCRHPPTNRWTGSASCSTTVPKRWKCAAPRWLPGDAVKVIKGPLAGLEGELITVNGKSKVAVRLDMLGCAHVDVPIGFVEKKGEGMEGQKNKKTKEIQKRRQQEEKAVR